MATPRFVPKPPALPQAVPTSQRLNTVLTTSVAISPWAQERVREQLLADWNTYPMAATRVGYALLDTAYYLESSEHLKETAARKIIADLYKELELPVLQPNIDAAHAYLVSLFLSGHPIFGVVGEKRERTDAAKQMEAIIEENSRHSGWARQLSMFFKTALKYNVAAIEVEWVTRTSFNLITDTNQSMREGTVTTALRSGNEFRTLDMYNTAFDMSVPPAEVHTRGDFVINVERLTMAQTHARLTELTANGGVLMNNTTELWKTSPMHNWYHIPRIRENALDTGKSGDWVSFFSTGSAPMSLDSSRKYEWVTYIRRIIPSMFGFPPGPGRDTVQIWKFYELNGVLVYAERKSNAHNYLPVIIGQPNEDMLGTQSKGMGEFLWNFQRLSSTMMKARLSSLQRALADRGLYDPSRIAKKDINSPNPSAKIPVRPGAYGTGLGDAYYPIPYDDRNAQNLYGDIGQVMGWAADAAHVNRSNRGQFTKGNRTLQEYNDVMDNADSHQQATALLLENQVFVPLKHIVKVNILQYQNPTSLIDPNTAEPVDIDPVQLRQAILDFKLADGLLSKDKILGVTQTIEAFQILLQSPEANQQYDLTAGLVDSLEARGARIKIYPRAQPLPQPGAPATAAVPGAPQQ